MSRIENIVDRISRYLKGLLSNRERHDLEKEMMQDVFDEEAFEGLNRLTGEELETDMEKMMNRLDNRIENKKTRTLWFYRMAAAIVLLIGISSILLLVVKKPADELITQKTEQIAKPSETATLPVEAPESEASNAKEQAKTYPAKKSTESDKVAQAEAVIEDITVQDDLVIMEEQEAIVLNDEPDVAREETKMYAPIAESYEVATAAPATAKSKKDGAVRIRGVSSITPSGSISGRVVDVQGQPLPGVNVLIKGTNQGTVTDMYGYFSLQPDDDNAVLALSYIGYNSLEVNPQEATGQEITLTEDLVALDEVVVVGYGTQKKVETALQGRAAGVSVSNDTEENKSAYSFIRPVPPNGSYKEFKEYVESRINKSLFISFPGKHRITIHLTVGVDGSVNQIQAEDKVPSVITDEYIRVITASDLWQPAKENGVPVEAEIALRFMLEVE